MSVMSDLDVGISESLERIPTYTAIHDAKFMQAPYDNEYSLLRLRCAYFNYQLKAMALQLLVCRMGV